MPESPKTRFPARRPRLVGSGTNLGPDRADHELVYEPVEQPGPPPRSRAKMMVRAWCKAPRCDGAVEGRFGPVTEAFDQHLRDV
jgi:hypothetical protein